MGAEDLLADHMPAHAMSHELVATSFLRVPRRRLFDLVLGPEIRAYHWMEDKLGGIWHKLFDGGEVLPEQARMVDYYAASCPHCKTLTPAWKQAADQWAGQPDAKALVWEEKQCLDENWKPGKDFEECQAQNVHGFPSIKFFPAGSKTGDDFFLERTPDRLLQFAKTGINPTEVTIPRAQGDRSDLKMVDFYAAGCGHCKQLEPVWAKAEKQWDAAVKQNEDAPVITFEKKRML